MRSLVFFAIGIFCGAEDGWAQDLPQLGTETTPVITKPATTVPLPTRQATERYRPTAQKEPHPREFIKNLTIESFGYSSAQTGPGYEARQILSPSSFATHGLECPLCLPFPNMLRTRYTIPAFGMNATLHLWRSRVELFSIVGGINAVKPDNYIWDMQRPRSTSYNDAWLMQGMSGGRIAIDPGRHLWLGGSAGYFENYGEGKRHWNAASANATFRFGR